MQSVQAATALVEALVELGVTRFVLSPGSRSAPLAYALADAEAVGQIELYVRLDERGAGFFALGLAKASGQPAALVCTSGTAAANYLPAILEADLSAIPIIILTADRPAELRGAPGELPLASQTLKNQQNIFGKAVRGALDLQHHKVIAHNSASTPERAGSVPPSATTPAWMWAVPPTVATPEWVGALRHSAAMPVGQGAQNLESVNSMREVAQWAVNLAANPAHPGPVHLNLQYREPLHP